MTFKKFDFKTFTLGVLAALAPAVTAAWAFATIAAHYVIDPHITRAKERVHLMCTWARIQDENMQKVCEAVGAACDKMDPQVIIDQCEEIRKENQ